jgi:hypothetical protein
MILEKEPVPDLQKKMGRHMYNIVPVNQLGS